MNQKTELSKRIANQIQKLNIQLKKWNYHYYELNQPLVSDAIYDFHYRKLLKLEQLYPLLKRSDSITQKVGYKASSLFRKIKHQRPMLSLDKAFNYVELKAFENRVNKVTAKKHTYFCELKADGLPISVIFQNHFFQFCITRGDGEVGEDVTNNVLTLQDFSQRFSQKFAMTNFELRGEVFMSKVQFQKLNITIANQIKIQFEVDINQFQKLVSQLRNHFPNYQFVEILPLLPALDFTWNKKNCYQFQIDVRMQPKNISNANSLLKLKQFCQSGKRFYRNWNIKKLDHQNFQLMFFQTLPFHFFLNPRNVASGSLRQLDSNITKNRKLAVGFFDFFTTDLEPRITTQQGSIAFIKNQLKLPIIEHARHCSTLSDVWKWIQEIDVKRTDLPLETDGVVIKVNEFKFYQKLGNTGKFPRYAIAYKFSDKVSESQVLKIMVSVGRTGKIIYVAKLKPTFLEGSIIQNVTLHNAEYIQKLQLQVYDYVKFKKSGGVIPKIIAVNFAKRPINSAVWKPSTICPFCLEKLISFIGEVDQYCVNMLCSEIILRRIEHFVSRKAYNIVGLSTETIKQLYHLQLIKDAADLFTLPDRKKELEALIVSQKLVKFQTKALNNLLNAIKNAKKQPLNRLLHALGVRHLGAKAAKLLAEHFQTLVNLLNADQTEWLKLNGIGPKLVDSWKKFISNQKNHEFMNKLCKLGVNTHHQKNLIQTDFWLSGKKIVITGTFSISRTELINVLENRSVIVVDQISSKVNYLLVGTNPGNSKLVKANKLEIPTLKSDQIEKLWLVKKDVIINSWFEDNQ